MEAEHRWHGWARSPEPDARSLFIGPLPRRKSIALYENDGTTIRILAYFESEAHARATQGLLDYLTGLPPDHLLEDDEDDGSPG